MMSHHTGSQWVQAELPFGFGLSSPATTPAQPEKRAARPPTTSVALRSLGGRRDCPRQADAQNDVVGTAPVLKFVEARIFPADLDPGSRWRWAPLLQIDVRRTVPHERLRRLQGAPQRSEPSSLAGTPVYTMSHVCSESLWWRTLLCCASVSPQAGQQWSRVGPRRPQLSNVNCRRRPAPAAQLVVQFWTLTKTALPRRLESPSGVDRRQPTTADGSASHGSLEAVRVSDTTTARLCGAIVHPRSQQWRGTTGGRSRYRDAATARRAALGSCV